MDLAYTERLARQIIPDLFDERFRRMVTRRGYTLDLINDNAGCYARVSAGGRQVMNRWVIAHVKLLALIEHLDRVVGQHHMQCRCGMPLLQQIDTDRATLFYQRQIKPPLFISNGKLLLDPGMEQMQLAMKQATSYRTTSAGPDSEPITVCPNCGALLSEAICEIDDLEGVAEEYNLTYALERLCNAYEAVQIALSEEPIYLIEGLIDVVQTTVEEYKKAKGE